MSTPSTRWRALWAVAVSVFVLALLMAGSLALYNSSRHWFEDGILLGDFDNPDRIDLILWVSRVDPATTTATVTVTEVQVNGKYADDEGYLAQAAKLDTNSFSNASTALPMGEALPAIEQRFGLLGIPTDYPFDSYSGLMAINIVLDDGTVVPTTLTVFNTDPFFRADLTQDSDTNVDGLDADLLLKRSTPTVLFAMFIMVLMLGLAAAALVAAYYALRWRRGLVLPACSMMAAILFALIPLRNAVPGGPPIGSLIDFASFFIAEAVIAIALITSVVLGYRHDIAFERSEAAKAGQSIHEYALGRKP
ncbi:DUF4436 family protein [Mycolicibacterium sp. S2-37]|uniref:DUF4436 family protein n=1 Tax=Mycolicibacterium sp. S2-37 TaxID=2810297 RepID=UPI001A95410B|nr:DUF4436 family protein [Mycolicibacterium sp. S2-37]MBO0678548.1 DUF4436 family protein [Mycolicibacterium sp. S2-37]